jgi:hypothetical protein
LGRRITCATKCSAQWGTALLCACDAHPRRASILALSQNGACEFNEREHAAEDHVSAIEIGVYECLERNRRDVTRIDEWHPPVFNWRVDDSLRAHRRGDVSKPVLA